MLGPQLSKAAAAALLLLAVLHLTGGFNLSPQSAIVFSDPQLAEERQTYFGYAVGLRSRRRYDDHWSVSL